ncbi:MAG: GHMP kinase [Betaproteobacteria bacterium]|nr:GHMP kinase [Betaproteobacteria bacterium]
MAATNSVTVRSGARLHMGFFDLNGGLGRKFGSIGLTLTEPQLVVNVRSSDSLHASGGLGVPQSVIEKSAKIAEGVLLKLGVKKGLELNLLQHIPEHAGLGSGTQMALAIGMAVSRLYGLMQTTGQIAELTGRGGRSGIGIAAFDRGGLLIDGGRPVEQAFTVPPLLARYHFPEQWRILLIFDLNQYGVHGEQEKLAFSALPAFPENLAAQLCRHVLMQAMPAMVEQDLRAFGQSIQALQMHVGDYFAPTQGGRYASKTVSAVLDSLGEMGVACFGQSSWGPTGFAVFESEQEAERHLDILKSRFSDQVLSWKICGGNNHGAEFI